MSLTHSIWSDNNSLGEVLHWILYGRTGVGPREPSVRSSDRLKWHLSPGGIREPLDLFIHSEGLKHVCVYGCVCIGATNPRSFSALRLRHFWSKLIKCSRGFSEIQKQEDAAGLPSEHHWSKILCHVDNLQTRLWNIWSLKSHGEKNKIQTDWQKPRRGTYKCVSNFIYFSLLWSLRSYTVHDRIIVSSVL